MEKEFKIIDLILRASEVLIGVAAIALVWKALKDEKKLKEK